MPKYQVSKSITINAPADKIYNSLINLSEWKEWSPWLIQEPEAIVSTSADNKTHEWEGKRLGHGRLSIVEVEKNRKIDYTLEYFKPWKSVSDTHFLIEDEGTGTKVTWTMDGKLPFFMFWMKPMMKAYLGMDYSRGLNMLKDYIETGKLSTQLIFNGVQHFEGCNYVGIRRVCPMHEINAFMPKDIGDITNMLQVDNLILGPCFAIYHKWKIVKGLVSYTVGLPVAKKPEDLPSKFIYSQIPATKVYEIEHTGDYKFLGNAWSTLSAMDRNKEIKANRKIDPFEIYMNDPNEVPAKELITKVCYPIK